MLTDKANLVSNAQALTTAVPADSADTWAPIPLFPGNEDVVYIGDGQPVHAFIHVGPLVTALTARVVVNDDPDLSVGTPELVVDFQPIVAGNLTFLSATLPQGYRPSAGFIHYGIEYTAVTGSDLVTAGFVHDISMLKPYIGGYDLGPPGDAPA